MIIPYSALMPELPEVETTVNGLRRRIAGLKIVDAWSDYDSRYFRRSETIKDPSYFRRFKKEIMGRRVVSVERRAKNILINLSGGATILVHMKMTGHLLYGSYRFDAAAKKDPWVPIEPEGLRDPYNRRVHFMIGFDNGKKLALSDLRKFAKVAVLDTELAHESIHLDGIGPEPLEKGFSLERFNARLDMKPNGKIKQVLLDQSIIAGIGNIYSDEALWRAGIHPLERVRYIAKPQRKKLYDAVRKTLARGIDFGGDSMSDYRNVDGERGRFQEMHAAYRRTGMRCKKPGCGGVIERIKVGGRSAHFCSRHQVLIESGKKKAAGLSLGSKS